MLNNPIYLSHARRIIRCPRSLHNLWFKNTVNDINYIGTTIHEHLECLVQEYIGLFKIGKDFDMKEVLDNYFAFEKEDDKEVLRKVKVCFKMVYPFLVRAQVNEGIPAIETEVRLDLKDRYVKSLPGKSLGGVADLIITDIDGLHVIDFKSGELEVNPADSDQLKIYGAMALNLYLPKAVDTDVWLTIIQPKQRTPQTYKASHAEVNETVTRLFDAIKDARKANPSEQMGEHCRFCPAASMNCMAPFNKSSKGMTLAEKYDAWTAMEYWGSSLKSGVKTQINNGTDLPGFTRTTGKGRSVIIKEQTFEDIKEIADKEGVIVTKEDIIKPEEFMPLGKIKESFGSSADALEDIIFTPKTVKIVRSDADPFAINLDEMNI